MDRRTYNSEQTQRHIEETFLGLLAKKPVDRFSVTELCRAGGIAKSTFYLYFSDKYAVMERLEQRVWADLAHINRDFANYPVADILVGRPTPIAGAFVRYLSENKRMLRILFGPTGDPQFFRRGKQEIERGFIALYRAQRLPARHEKLVASHFFNVNTGLIFFYLFENTVYTDEEIVLIFGTMLKSSLELQIFL